MPVSRRVTVIGGVIATFVAMVVAFLGNTALSTAAAQQSNDKPVIEFSDEGKLKQPKGFHKWPYIGTPVTPNDLNDGDAPFPEFHIVYMDPDSFAHYEKTGEYRDGTVLIKELTSVGSKEATSCKGYFMGDYTGLEASIKDSHRFKEEPGNWGYFSFGHKHPLKDQATKNAVASCNDCHQKNAKSDYVFSQYYPVLRDAAPKKK